MQAMKDDADTTDECRQGHDQHNAPLDARIADLHARIEKNKAELERTNARLGTKLEELSKRVGLSK